MDQVEVVSLVVEGGAQDRETIALGAPTTTMGRQSGNDVVVAEAGVSRKHAEIVEADSAYSLRDLKSTNGTFVNSEKLTDGEHTLRDGDRIRLGASKVIFVFRTPAASTLAVTLQDLQMAEAEGPATMVGVPVPGPVAERRPSFPQTIVNITKGDTDQFSVPDDMDDLYEGTVRLNVHQKGGMGLVVSFVQQLREK